MAKNDPDGKTNKNSSVSELEADTFRDHAAGIERNYQTRVRQGLLSIARANLAKASRMSAAKYKRGQDIAVSGASGLQAFGSRHRAATSEAAQSTREAQAAYRLDVTAMNQQIAQDGETRSAAHAVNLRDLLNGRYA